MMRSRIAALTAAAVVLLVFPARAEAAAGIVQDELTPTTAQLGTPVAATLKVHAPECTTVKKMGVALRDGLWNDLNYATVAENVQVCPEGFTLTTEARPFRAGTYTQFGWYLDETGYHELDRTTFTVTGSDSHADRANEKPVVWAEEFNAPIPWGERWTNTGTAAYRFGNRNPSDGKLDWVSPDRVNVADGVATFTAQPSWKQLESGKQAWDTGMISTEASGNGFQLRTGDYVETLVELPTAVGAWPAVWTWKEDGHEIDILEYHPDLPDVLEQCNHIRYAANFHKIRPPSPGEWTRIGVHIGEESIDWYVNGVLIYQDGRGVPPDWSAYLVMSLSVSDGNTFHRAPQTLDPIMFRADYIRVHR